MKGMHMVAFILTIIGGLNWGLVGIGGFAGDETKWNLVKMLLGQWPPVEWAVYILVALAAIWLAVMHKNDCKWCSGSHMSGMGGGMPM
jgi:uncharacterized protein